MKTISNKKEITILSIGANLILAIIILYFSQFKEYINILITLLIIDIIIYIIYKYNTRTPNSIFKSKVKNIVNTYDSILAKIDLLPDLTDKDIIFIPKFEELINTQGETKKPIFYNVTDKTASFILIDNNLVCYSIIKEDETLVDPFESKLMVANAKKNVKDVDESILADLDKTTIIKLPNIGSYKVSPIRKKDTQVKEENNDKPIEETKPIKINHATERARKFREKNRKNKKQ